jgi:hypothetical protein
VHGAAAEQVQVEMVYRLSTILARVDYGAVAFIEPLLACDLGYNPEQMTEQRSLCRRRFRKRADVPARDDEHMRGGVRVKVGKGDALIILIDTGGGNASIDDLAEQATHIWSSIGSVFEMPFGLSFCGWSFTF